MWGVALYAYILISSPAIRTTEIFRFFDIFEHFIADGITEQLKAENQLKWVGRMNNVCSRATEIVNAELIFDKILHSTCNSSLSNSIYS